MGLSIENWAVPRSNPNALLDTWTYVEFLPDPQQEGGVFGCSS